MVLSGGVLPQHVIVNMLPGSTNLKLTGASAAYSGTFLAVQATNATTLTGASRIYGAVYARDVTLTGGSQINHSAFDCGATIPNLDYGDAGGLDPASQAVHSAIRIGTLPTDADASAAFSDDASADDLSETDDEDLVMPSFVIGASTTLTVPVTINAASLSGSTARLGVFVDWTNDGDVLDANETLPPVTVNASGRHVFTVTPPPTVQGGQKFLRLRIAEGSVAPASSGDYSLKGEVEDYVIQVVGMSIGNLVWIDANNDGIKNVSESGEPGVTVQLWTPGANAIEENGGGDDVKIGGDIVTDINGNYLFSGLPAGTYYVRIPSPPADFPLTSGVPDTADNQQDGDNNGRQVGGAGTAIRSPIITLTAGAEPAAGMTATTRMATSPSTLVSRALIRVTAPI